jgi:CubicO group peptidase (beta-lactamase class C family)
LATSTSGIRHYTSDDPSYNTQHFTNVFDALDRFKDDELLFEPGSDFEYSSYGWVLLSAVMERASGTPFKELMKTAWQQLGLEHTYFDESSVVTT